MADEQKTTDSSQNEGEGNKTAARQYNEAQKGFAQSGKVEEKAREAEQALDGPEKAALQHAEDVGRSHIAGEGQRTGDAVANTADKVGDAVSHAGGHATELLNETEDLIRQNPWLSVLTAAAVGYMWARSRR
jgi:ElaB/YqjD/DUF883 family membrane-anchored ribosome-binding protein